MWSNAAAFSIYILTWWLRVRAELPGQTPSLAVNYVWLVFQTHVIYLLNHFSISLKKIKKLKKCFYPSEWTTPNTIDVQGGRLPSLFPSCLLSIRHSLLIRPFSADVIDSVKITKSFLNTWRSHCWDNGVTSGKIRNLRCVFWETHCWQRKQAMLPVERHKGHLIQTPLPIASTGAQLLCGTHWWLGRLQSLQLICRNWLYWAARSWHSLYVIQSETHLTVFSIHSWQLHTHTHTHTHTLRGSQARQRRWKTSEVN